MQPCDILPKLLIVPDTCLLILQMPGAQIDMRLMQCFLQMLAAAICVKARAGRAAASDGSAGTNPNTLRQWKWPSDDCALTVYQRG